MVQNQDIFLAISDPTRRQIITMLAEEPLNVNTIAGHFDITRQAVSLHLQFLNDCGLVNIKKKGRERYCEAQLDRLSEITDWVEASKKIWLHRFRSLENFLENLENKDHLNPKNRKNAKRK